MYAFLGCSLVLESLPASNVASDQYFAGDSLSGKIVPHGGNKYHVHCFTCVDCDVQLETGVVTVQGLPHW